MVVDQKESVIVPPPVTWAQRNRLVYLTICLEDCHDPEIKIETDKVYFKGIGGTEQKPHEITIELHGEIDPEKSEKAVRERNIELTLKKKEQGFWPQLTKEKKKYHWLKVDFHRWVDESSSEDEADVANDFDSFMKKIGGGGGDGKPSMEDIPIMDSDDEDLPDLE